MIAIKNWFIYKNNLRGLRNFELIIKKETEKAILLTTTTDKTIEAWVPKSVIIDKWEKDIHPFAYHDYLENIYHKAYNEKIIENRTIKSGRNVYRGDNFIHQCTTKELQASLDYYNVEYMSFKDWKERR